MTGTVGILNVGAGDTKLVFDKDNPAECIRSARIVTDMLRRGYALLVETERNGKKAYERVREFRADTCEYIIADFDPEIAAVADRSEGEPIHEEESAGAKDVDQGQKAASKKGRPSKTKPLHASKTHAVAVARTAGG